MKCISIDSDFLFEKTKHFLQTTFRSSSGWAKLKSMRRIVWTSCSWATSLTLPPRKSSGTCITFVLIFFKLFMANKSSGDWQNCTLSKFQNHSKHVEWWFVFDFFLWRISVMTKQRSWRIRWASRSSRLRLRTPTTSNRYITIFNIYPQKFTGMWKGFFTFYKFVCK